MLREALRVSGAAALAMLALAASREGAAPPAALTPHQALLREI